MKCHLVRLFMFVILPVLTLLISQQQSVEGTSTKPKVCVANDDVSASKSAEWSDPTYVCRDVEPVSSEREDGLVHSSDFLLKHTGVEQRIDGSIGEKKAVRRVLEKMESYFRTEVLARPEYALVRGQCQNHNELCAFWASVSECESNRGFMLTNCAAACRLCLLMNTKFNI